jgi:glycosyltransferase involved in cell wall biosynthesis
MLTDLYYLIKPFLPWRLRLWARQLRARHKLRSLAGTWPIDPAAGSVPPGWNGWPEGKKFAFVLTHDVEGTKGADRIRQLMNIDRKHGYASCFNLVAEGSYPVAPHVSMLQAAGFEVGIHGLLHDGKLYRSKKEFSSRAVRIREHAKSWSVCGFRSPLMQHELGWIHALGCEYDSSTFDSDPFEPQPDGVGTIFPFWVAAHDHDGYVELPYTLVQDFTLFILLREPDITIWKKKLDWVAEHGGMALVNVHPDYVSFNGEPGQDEYPVSLYEDLLRYVRQTYGDTAWYALPRDLARYYRNASPISVRNTRRKVCMVAYTDYESDNRVRRYAETLAKRGDIVDVIAHSVGSSDEPYKQINGVNVYQIQKRQFDERTPWGYGSRLISFLGRSSVTLTRLHARNRYDVIHVHNMPDFLVFAAWYPKLTGAKVILDIHDIMPELFESKFATRFRKVYVWLLKAVEKRAARFSDHIILSNHLWRDKLIGRSVVANKCSVIVNHVDPDIFAPRAKTRNDGKFIVIFPGTFQWHQGLDIGIEAFSHFKQKIPNAEFHLYGGGNGTVEAELRALVRRLGLEESVKFCGRTSLDRVAEIIANADLGVVPKRADSFGNEAYSTKIMEFMSQGIPVVASRTKIDTYYFDEGVVHFFRSGDSREMAQAMFEVASNQTLRESLIANGFEYVRRHGWGQKKQEYLDLVDRLSTERFDEIRPLSPVKAAVDC